MSRRWIPVIVLALLFFVPGVAHACPVCFDPRDQSNGTFLASTAFLSLFPLGMLGSAGLWVRKRIRDMRAGEQGEESEE
ncbi:MAG: hypothetical protein LJF04_10840 [Gemmatimonadetes bacterium]|nr:hypothetical protein [Gemmatimonadota bacterium]